jgi:hypothetical protein
MPLLAAEDVPGRLACTAFDRSGDTGMEITGLGWYGARTGRCSELAYFYEHVLGLRPVYTEAEFWVFELADGRLATVSAAAIRARSIPLPARLSASPFGSVVPSGETGE